MAADQDFGKCAHCNEDGKFSCGGCHRAPEYATGDVHRTDYCSKECQNAHRPAHRTYCRSMWKRRTLLRVARLLKAVLLAYRECVFDLDISKVELNDGVLQLHQKQRPAAARKQYRLFPSEVTESLEYKEAALVHNQSMTALALFARLAKKLLSDFATSIESCFLRIKKPAVRTELVPGPNSNDGFHAVLKVGLKGPAGDFESWALDPAGCQYGFLEVLVPYATYLKQGEVVREPEPYDWTETTDLDRFERSLAMNLTAAQEEDAIVERKIRKEYALFVRNRFGSSQPSAVKDLLYWTLPTFGQQLDVLTEDLKQYMSLYMEERGFYTDHFSTPAQRRPTPKQRLANFSLLANVLPCFLPSLTCLKMRLGTPQVTGLVLRYFRCGPIVKPFDSVTALVLDTQTDRLYSPNGYMLKDYSQLFALADSCRKA
ncbi:hypothetical protein PG988_005859 [Apiospora saccharicola]